MDAPLHCMNWMYKFPFKELPGELKSGNREHFKKKKTVIHTRARGKSYLAATAPDAVCA